MVGGGTPHGRILLFCKYVYVEIVIICISYQLILFRSNALPLSNPCPPGKNFGQMPGGGDMIPGQFRCYIVNLVPRVVSEPLFQYSSQKTTLARGGESFLWEYLKLPILGFECRTLCCSLLFRHFIFSMDDKTFCPTYLNMHQINSRDKKSVKSNLKQSYFRIGVGDFIVHRFETTAQWQRS